MRSLRRFLASIAVLASVFLTHPRTIATNTPQRYIVTDLGTLGGSFSYAEGINNLGQIIGNSTVSDGRRHAFLYDHGSMHDLGVPEGFVESFAKGINDSGQVVGHFLDANGNGGSGFLYSDGVMTPLGFGPNAINNHGQISGKRDDKVVRAEPDGTVHELGTAIYGLAINDSGQVAGAFVVDDRIHGYRTGANLPINPATDDLGTLMGEIPISVARGINNAGEVVGDSNVTIDGSSRDLPFLYRNGAMINLAAGTNMIGAAQDINNLGQVVGGTQAFIYDDTNGFQDLNMLIPAGWFITSANAINDLGQIVGFGSHNGEQHALLLTPTNDTTPPTISISVPDNAVYDLDQIVPASYNCDDNDSGISTCAGTVANGSNIDTSTVGTKTFTVTSSDRAGNETSSSFNYTVISDDTITPEISVSSPGASNYVVNQFVAADYDCTDINSGISTCSGTVNVGEPIDTSSLGTKSFTVTATDRAGNQSTQTIYYTVINTGTGSNVVVEDQNVQLNFSSVVAVGNTFVTAIDPSSVGNIPGGFAVSSSLAYQITSTATFSGPVTLGFKIPGPISVEDFNNLAILHSYNGSLVDETSGRDYSTLTIYAVTNSFSPFYVLWKGKHVRPLFDQTKAFKSGSTIPIKLQLLNSNNANLSSGNTALSILSLRLVGGNTESQVVDSGNANADYNFRYDPTLGGTGGGYIFNLQTKGLLSGQYVLSFYVEPNHGFFYTVKFEIK